MILRKPYAFLIKKFKIIHLILSLLMIYVAYKINSILNFIYDYINNIANVNIASSYINFILFLAVVFIIIISLILYILMRYKKKPKLLYLFTIITYIIIFITLFFVMLTFQSMEKDIIDPKTIRLVRDVIKLILYPEYIFIIVMIVRTLGFDIKKFDFKSDIEEMNIDISDNEEVELSVGINFDKVKTKGRRRIRELKYYVLENKIFVFTILGLLGIGIIIYLILNINVVNKIYKENEFFNTSYFTMNITNSYVTNKNDTGENVSIEDKSYIIIKFDVKCLYNDGINYKLDPNRFLLEVAGKTYTPTLKYYESFKAIGNGYKNQNLSYDEYNTYIFVYNIENDYLKENKYIRYEEGFEYVNKEYIANTKKIKIIPQNIDNSSLEGTYNINDTIDLSNSILDGSFKISSYEINKKFVYEYQYCIGDKCEALENTIISSYDGQLLKLTVENTNDRFNNYDFSNKFIKVKYKIGEDEYTSSLNNKTPSSSTTTMYFNVDNKIVEADSIWLEITIRNKLYKYILK